MDQHPFALPYNMQARLSLETLRQKFQQVDLIVADLDHCIFPGYSQAYQGALIALKIFFSPEHLNDISFLPALMAGGLFITYCQLKSLLGINTPNKTMLKRFEATMHGIPQFYFYWAAKKIPPKSHAGALETLVLLAEKAPLGIISFAPDSILQAYQDHLAGTTEKGISFYDANKLVFQQGSSRKMFCAYCNSSMMWHGSQKTEALQRRIREFKVSTPLVIGHGLDDCHMAGYARAMGGLSIGFNPHKNAAAHFDVLVRGRSWHPLLKLLKNHLLSSKGSLKP